MKRVVSMVLCIFLLFSLTGCWSSNELNDYAFTIGLAFDKGINNGKIMITAQVAKPSALKSGGNAGGGSDEKAYLNLKNEGDTVFNTLRGFTHHSARKLNYQHNKIVIFGREIAEQSVQPFIDFFTRDHEIRNVWVIVAKERAEDILEVDRDLQKIPSNSIEKMIKAQEFTSETYTIKAVDFINRILSKSAAPVAPLLEVIGEGEEQKMVMSGAAVFNQHSMIGELNKAETRGLLWVMGEIKSGVVVVDCPDGMEKVEIEIYKASSAITPKIENGTIHIQVEINEKGHLNSQSCTENLSTSEMLKSLESKQAASIYNEIMSSVKKAQELKADIFCFGEAVQRKYPKEWADLENRWDDIFPNVQVEVIIHGQIYGTGKVSKPVN